MNAHATPVPPVDPRQLQSVLKIVFPAPADDDDSDTLGHADLRHTLDAIVSELKVDAAGAIALFKRALALSAYCADDTLADHLFEDGMPGRALCSAAATVPVIDLPGDDDGEIGHTLDAAAMRSALKSSRH